MYMNDIEENLKTSGRIENDPGLNAYVRQIICNLVPDQCSDIRLYIVQTPHFNASMAPNGFMQIWTGLMLRAQNEAQLAYVLGHEIGHYQKRHSLKQWRSVRDTSSVLIFLQLTAAGAGVGPQAAPFDAGRQRSPAGVLWLGGRSRGRMVCCRGRDRSCRRHGWSCSGHGGRGWRCNRRSR